LLITAAVGPVLDDVLASASPTTIGGSFLDHPFILLITYFFATTNILTQWHGLQPDETGFVPLTIAEFSL